MKQLRLYAGSDGESHVEDFVIDYAMMDYAPPAPAFGISAPRDASRFVMVHFPAHWDSEPHPSPRRQLFVLLSGQFEGRASDGTIMTMSPGDIVLMEDTTGKGHTAKALGGKDVHAMMIHLD